MVIPLLKTVIEPKPDPAAHHAPPSAEQHGTLIASKPPLAQRTVHVQYLGTVFTIMQESHTVGSIMNAAAVVELTTPIGLLGHQNLVWMQHQLVVPEQFGDVFAHLHGTQRLIAAMAAEIHIIVAIAEGRISSMNMISRGLPRYS